MRGRSAAATVLTLAVLLAGCGDDGDGGSAEEPRTPDSGLPAALAAAPVNDVTTPYVEYGNVAAVGQVTGDEVEPRLRAVQGPGYSSISAQAAQVAELTGIDPTRADWGVVVGQPPNQATRLEGSFDTDTINDRLADLGGEQENRGGATVWTFAPDHEVALDSPFADIAIVNAFNVIYVSPDRVVFGPAHDVVMDLVDPGPQTLVNSEVHRVLAECLGSDVTVALMEVGSEVSQAVGVHMASAEDVTDLWCLHPDSGGDDLVDRVESELADGRAANGRPWSEILPDPTVEVLESGVIRVSSAVVPDRPVGQVVRAMLSGDLAALAAS